MFEIPNPLRDLSQRIEDAEQRLARLRAHMNRCAAEGHHTPQARELLAVMKATLHQLYAERRRLVCQRWTMGYWRSRAGLKCSIGSDSLPTLDAHGPALPPKAPAIPGTPLPPRGAPFPSRPTSRQHAVV